MWKPSHQVTVHALAAGWFTMPERFFVHPLEDTEARNSVPFLPFLIQHVAPDTETTTRLVFYLGLRRNIEHYNDQILAHVATRKPLSTLPDVTESLAKGGLAPANIDAVI